MKTRLDHNLKMALEAAQAGQVPIAEFDYRETADAFGESVFMLPYRSRTVLDVESIMNKLNYNEIWDDMPDMETRRSKKRYALTKGCGGIRLEMPYQGEWFSGVVTELNELGDGHVEIIIEHDREFFEKRMNSRDPVG